MFYNCNCNTSCDVCSNLVFATPSFADGTLTLNIPERSFQNCQLACIVVIGPLPAGTTLEAPVVLTIGSDTTQYPLVTRRGTPVTASMLSIRGNCKLKARVNTTTTGAVFMILDGLINCNSNVLNSIPTSTVTATATNSTGG